MKSHPPFDWFTINWIKKGSCHEISRIQIKSLIVFTFQGDGKQQCIYKRSLRSWRNCHTMIKNQDSYVSTEITDLLSIQLERISKNSSGRLPAKMDAFNGNSRWWAEEREGRGRGQRTRWKPLQEASSRVRGTCAKMSKGKRPRKINEQLSTSSITVTY